MRAGVETALFSLYNFLFSLDLAKCACIAYSNKNIHLKRKREKCGEEERGLSLETGFRWRWRVNGGERHWEPLQGARDVESESLISCEKSQ